MHASFLWKFRPLILKPTFNFHVPPCKDPSHHPQAKLGLWLLCSLSLCLILETTSHFKIYASTIGSLQKRKGWYPIFESSNLFIPLFQILIISSSHCPSARTSFLFFPLLLCKNYFSWSLVAAYTSAYLHKYISTLHTQKQKNKECIKTH